MIDDIAMIQATRDDGSSFWSVITISDRLIDNLSCFDDQYRCHTLFSELTDQRQSTDPPKAGQVLRAFAGALRASDPEAAIALLGPEFSVVDHRRIGLGTLDRDRYADSLRSATAMGSMALSRARRIRDGGALTVTRNYYRDAGTGQEYVDTVSLLLADDQHVTRIEHFGPDEWAAALARFDELTADHQLAGARFDLEAIALLIANSAQHARGIVHKRERVQHAHDAALKVGQAAPVIVQFAVMVAIQAQGQGVDGEIAAVQIELDAAALNRWQGGRVFIKLGAG